MFETLLFRSMGHASPMWPCRSRACSLKRVAGGCSWCASSTPLC